MATPVTALNNLNAELEQQLVQNTVAAVAPANQAPAPAANNNNDTVTISEAAQQAAAAAAPAAAQPATPQPTFLQILALSEQGLTAQQIAQALGVSVQAVEVYLGQQPAGGANTNTLA